jgi:uncharacterized repeat protein (TIGR01451 family)
MKTSVTGIPALALEVVDIEDPVRIGDHATYVIRVENQGSATATNIRVACLLENNVQDVSSAGATVGSLEGQTVRFYPLGALQKLRRPGAWSSDQRPGAIQGRHDADQQPAGGRTESTHIYE